jgi:hypothetical protein
MVQHWGPYVGIVTAFLVVVVAGIRSWRSSVKLNAQGWHQLLSQLQTVNVGGIIAVANDYLHPEPDQIKIQPRAIWKLVGAYEGLLKMRTNADLMLALAAHAQHWNSGEATIVAERMRRDSIRLKRALFRIELGFLPWRLLHRFCVSTPFYIQEAAAAYYLMRERLLALYATSHAGRYPLLAEAI